MIRLTHFLRAEYMVPAGIQQGRLPGTREAYGAYLRLAWPAALEGIFVSLLAAVDTIMVGGLGAAAIAAVGITNQPRFLVLTVVRALNVGVTALVARRRGAQDLQGVNDCLRQSIILSVALSAFLNMVSIVLAWPFLRFMGAGDDVLELAVTYFQITLFGNFFASVSLTINAAQIGMGNTRISMSTNLSANGVNLLFDYLLIGGIGVFPALGVTGAAIATLMSNITACALSFLSVLRREDLLTLRNHTGHWRFDRQTLAGMGGVGAGAFVEQVFMRIGLLSFAKIVASLGTVAFATNQICMNIINMSYSFGEGMGNATSSQVGQSLGEKRHDRAVLYGKVGQRVAILVSVFLFILFTVFRVPIMQLFTSEKAMIALGAVLNLIIAATCPFQTTALVFAGALRGAGDTKFVAVVSFLSIALLRPFISWLLCYPLGFGLVGAWLGLFADQLTRCALCAARFYRYRWVNIELR